MRTFVVTSTGLDAGGRALADKASCAADLVVDRNPGAPTLDGTALLVQPETLAKIEMRLRVMFGVDIEAVDESILMCVRARHESGGRFGDVSTGGVD